MKPCVLNRGGGGGGGSIPASDSPSGTWRQQSLVPRYVTGDVGHRESAREMLFVFVTHIRHSPTYGALTVCPAPHQMASSKPDLVSSLQQTQEARTAVIAHFAEEKTEALRGDRTCSKTHSQEVVGEMGPQDYQMAKPVFFTPVTRQQ